MQRADELYSTISRVAVPTDPQVMNAIVTTEGLVCARTSSGDYDVLIPAVPISSEESVGRIGSVQVISGREYLLQIGQVTQTGNYLRLSLASDRVDLLPAFTFTLAAMIPDESPIADPSLLSSRLVEILRLLQSAPQPTAESIKGLWAELWLIRASPDPSSALRGWHGRPTDKVDFEIDSCLLEVKCHEGRERLHTIALEQLLLRPEDTFIVSVCVAASPGGESIYDLMQAIRSTTASDDSQRLTSQVLSIVGGDVDLLSDYRFSIWPDVVPMAVPARFVPRPSVDDASISQVRFRVDLSEAATLHGVTIPAVFGSAQRKPD